MPTTPLVSLPEGLDIISVSETSEELLVRVTSTRSCSLCPLCSIPSQAIHSYYRRKPADLPCTGRAIRLTLDGPQVLLPQRCLSKESVCRTPSRAD